MLKIDTKIRIVDGTASESNLAHLFSAEDLGAIGTWVIQGYVSDDLSRAKWLTRNQNAMDLAMQVVKDKTFPWQGASNVKFPLLTVGAMQFHARAYPAIITGPDIVKYRTIGKDATGETRARATRVGKHMSWQLLEQDQSWEEGMDRLLINLPIVGTVFKKSYFSVNKGHNVSEIVLAKDLVVDYYATSIEDAARKTHQIPMFRNEIYSSCKSGKFVDVLDAAWYQAPSTYSPSTNQHPEQEDNRKGRVQPQPDESTPFLILEQHCSIDFDQDGYAEPYIVTVERSSGTVLRIVARWDRPEQVERNEKNEIIRIRSSEYFTKYGFIPSPDNSIYDIGFGILLGPLNSSVDSLINMLIDCGTMQTTAGGFLGAGAKLRSGKITFSPLEWHNVAGTGDDLRKNIVPLPVREPSTVLFQLLGLLVDYANRIPGTTDIMVGENVGQNTPAETARSLIEQGSKIYTALFKRVWRCMKSECRKLYLLNSMFLPESSPFGDSDQSISKADYAATPDNIVPAVDPNIVSDQVRVQRALQIKQSAMSTPGYDIEAVERNFLDALQVESPEHIYPGLEAKPPAQDPKTQLSMQKLQLDAQRLQWEQQSFIMTLQEERRMNSAKIAQIQADIAALMADTSGKSHSAMIEAKRQMLDFMKHRDDTVARQLEIAVQARQVEVQVSKMDNQGKKDE